MTNSLQYQQEILQDRYGLKLGARLSAGAEDLPHDISERLRVARSQAVAKRKMPLRTGAATVVASGGAAVLGREDGWGWWGRIATFLPLLALVAGLVTINAIQNDTIAREVADVDAALLVDDLPPAAYADPGFVQFVKASYDEAQ